LLSSFSFCRQQIYLISAVKRQRRIVTKHSSGYFVSIPTGTSKKVDIFFPDGKGQLQLYRFSKVIVLTIPMFLNRINPMVLTSWHLVAAAPGQSLSGQHRQDARPWHNLPAWNLVLLGEHEQVYTKHVLHLAELLLWRQLWQQ